LTIKIGNGQIITHPLNPLLLKKRRGLSELQARFFPLSFQEKGQRAEFEPKNITELENQNSLGVKLLYQHRACFLIERESKNAQRIFPQH
jgi:hypothetical protein